MRRGVAARGAVVRGGDAVAPGGVFGLHTCSSVFRLGLELSNE